MVEFHREALESYKYSDLVKLAKEHDVYRRYAPKIELVEKLMELSEAKVETLNDVSMPSFMESDDPESDAVDQDAENTLPIEDSNSSKYHVPLETVEVGNPSSFSPRAPLVDKRKNLNSKVITSKSESPITIKSRSSTPRALRRSLAGPAKHVVNDSKLSRQSTFEIDNKTDKPPTTPQPAVRRLTRQSTFEVKAQASNGPQLKREGTFDVEPTDKEVKPSFKKERSNRLMPIQKLKRDATFEVLDNIPSTKKVSRHSRPRKLRREGTFELENTANSSDSPQVVDLPPSTSLAVPTPKEESTSDRLSHIKKQARMSWRSPYQSRKVSNATPSSVKPVEKEVSAQSVPRRFITSRNKPVERPSSGAKTSATKSKTPSVIDDIHQKKVQVSAKKFADAVGEKPALARKVPDFGAIHKRLFGKMESLVDSRQKVIDRANSIQKLQLKSGKRSPANTKVVRKLLSPKAGKSKIASPKPTLRHVASAYTSNIVTIQKRPSVGSLIPGVSKLESPRFVCDVKSKGTTNQFGFTKAEPSRKEVLKATVMGRQPSKRISPMARAKRALQTVRLNKRFELQMKHRLAQMDA